MTLFVSRYRDDDDDFLYGDSKTATATVIAPQQSQDITDNCKFDSLSFKKKETSDDL